MPGGRIWQVTCVLVDPPNRRAAVRRSIAKFIALRTRTSSKGGRVVSRNAPKVTCSTNACTCSASPARIPRWPGVAVRFGPRAASSDPARTASSCSLTGMPSVQSIRSANPAGWASGDHGWKRGLRASTTDPCLSPCGRWYRSIMYGPVAGTELSLSGGGVPGGRASANGSASA